MKTVREIALERFKALDKTRPDLSDRLCGLYVAKHDKYYFEDRGHLAWVEYCVARDVFLHHLGKINLERELRAQSGPVDYKNYRRQ